MRSLCGADGEAEGRVAQVVELEGLSAGANDYIVKPFSSRELIARIDAQLQLHRLRKEVRAS